MSRSTGQPARKSEGVQRWPKTRTSQDPERSTDPGCRDRTCRDARQAEGDGRGRSSTGTPESKPHRGGCRPTTDACRGCLRSCRGTDKPNEPEVDAARTRGAPDLEPHWPTMDTGGGCRSIAVSDEAAPTGYGEGEGSSQACHTPGQRAVGGSRCRATTATNEMDRRPGGMAAACGMGERHRGAPRAGQPGQEAPAPSSRDLAPAAAGVL
uniref:Uncharacterized protein n=1 Tax=Aegilops tauschii subsp. strangulata TaxID=200361 RepID=A0A453EPI9_AEGTS